MKISPINIRYNTQTPISKKTKNTESGLQFELSKHSQTNPVYFSGLFTSKKTKVELEEWGKKLDEVGFEYTYDIPNVKEAITKPRKMFLNKFFSDERIYKDVFFKENLRATLVDIKDEEIAEYRIKALDVYLKNYDRIKERNLTSIIVNGVRNLRYEPQLDILDYTFSNDEVYKEGAYTYSAAKYYMVNKEYIEEEPQAEIFKTIISDENLYGNRNIQEHSFLMLGTRYSVPAQEKIKILKRFSQDPKLLNNEYLQRSIGTLTYNLQNQNQADIVNKILDNEELYDISSNLYPVLSKIESPDEAMFLEYVLNETRLYGDVNRFLDVASISCMVDSVDEAEAKIKLSKKVLDNEFLTEEYNRYSRFENLIKTVHSTEQADRRIAIMEKIISNEKLYKNDSVIEYLSYIVNKVTHEFRYNLINDVVDIYLNNDYLNSNEILQKNIGRIFDSIETEEKGEFAKIVLTNEKFYKNDGFLKHFCNAIYQMNFDGYSKSFWKVFNKVANSEELINNENVVSNLSHILSLSKFGFHRELVENVLDDKELYNNKFVMDNISNIISAIDEDEEYDFVCELLEDKELINDENFMNEASRIVDSLDSNNINFTKKLIKEYKKKEITAEQISLILRNSTEISHTQMLKANKIIGRDNLIGLKEEDLSLAYKFVDVYQKKDINEIATAGKKGFLKALISSNADLFKTDEKSDKIYEFFPLLPKNSEEYCELVRNIVISMGIETNEISSKQEKDFYDATISLAIDLAKISDEEFNNLEINQEYSKDEFIVDVYKLVRNLSKNERQKVYDYFGFELHHNKNGVVVNENGSKYSITGYPANLNNGKKLQSISDENTKAVVEQVRDLVIKFTENNKISCNKLNIEQSLNEIIKTMPEIRPLIGKVQHRTHDFDIMKHSLKVMQKIIQNENFASLNDSDKKLLLVASLLHDCTKAEGKRDGTHAIESAFDTFYIIQKLNLTKDEEIKLYSLVKHHEWLKEVNKDFDTEVEEEKTIKSVAYDLHYGNLFEMAKIFTEADLKAVKKDDEFFERYQSIFNSKSNEIRAWIYELKRTQPLLPVTKLPSASRIKEAITEVKEDGSTNIKGVYQTFDGIVILKFNEIQNGDWEKIGFPKGSISKGIKTTGAGDEKINTGNIKFFVHGLEEEKDLRKFDAFALPDSDALLSVSYAERPESKYRFFRSKGVIVNADAKYVHGGGKTDRGSGCNKNIDNFKEDYAFANSKRYEDRIFISNLIKENLKLNNEEYMNLVQANVNKPITEIEPKEYQEAIVKALATINSHVRHGQRSYNEMYLSNPEVMGLFAYNENEYYGGIDVVNFINRNEKYLKKYALEKDVPFIFFGK